MFVLDTNVVSELMGERLQPRVLAWLDGQLTSMLFVTAITEAEVRTGIAILPDGERRRGLAAAADRAIGVLFAERILPLDSDAASAYATIAAERRAAGRPMSHADCQTAAVARSRGTSTILKGVGST